MYRTLMHEHITETKNTSLLKRTQSKSWYSKDTPGCYLERKLLSLNNVAMSIACNW